jgi:hypothetical protein
MVWPSMSSTWKAALGTTIALCALIGLLFLTGLVRIGSSEDDGENGDAESEGDDETPVARRNAKRGKGKRAPRKKGRGPDLESLGYVGAVEIRPEDLGKVGVTKHVQDKVAGGLNLFNPCAWGRKYVRASGGKILREAQLIDMDGKVLHRWETTFGSNTTRGWEISRLSEDGFLYAINARSGFVKLDWDSNIVWGLEGGYHHDFTFGPDGNLWVLYEKKREVTHGEKSGLIWDNGVAIVSPDGKLIEEKSFYDQLKDDPAFIKSLETRMRRVEMMAKRGKQEETEDEEEDALDPKARAMDVFHANTIDFVNADVEGSWKKGDLITSLRELDMIAVIDPSTMEVRWKWGTEELDRPHDPSVLENGHVLLFDNGMHRGYSRILEIDPKDGNKEVWTYKGTEADPFFSHMRGLVQRMPNDNLLITSSQQGRVFEVDREGNILWEFWSTYVLAGKLRVPIRLVRLDGKALEFAQKKVAEAAG